MSELREERHARQDPQAPLRSVRRSLLAQAPVRHGHAPTEGVGGSKVVLLVVLLVAQLMVILDITAVNIALPSLAARPRTSAARTISWTITSYSLDLRQPAPLRRPRRRPARAPAHVPDRPRRLHRLVARLGPRGHRRRAVRRTRGPGPRRRDALSGRALDHHDRLPGHASGPRRSRPGARSAVPAPRSASSSAASSPSSPTGG